MPSFAAAEKHRETRLCLTVRALWVRSASFWISRGDIFVLKKNHLLYVRCALFG